jgi:hypothetical protein
VDTDVRRPGPLRWLWYAFGGGLPERYRAWVHHDTTARTWILRHVVRTMVQLAVPITLVLVLMPGAFWIRGMAALGGVLLGLFYSMAYMPETVEHRSVRAGFPSGTATRTREEAARVREAADSARRREAAAQRYARRRERWG